MSNNTILKSRISNFSRRASARIRIRGGDARSVPAVRKPHRSTSRTSQLTRCSMFAPWRAPGDHVSLLSRLSLLHTFVLAGASPFLNRNKITFLLSGVLQFRITAPLLNQVIGAPAYDICTIILSGIGGENFPSLYAGVLLLKVRNRQFEIKLMLTNLWALLHFKTNSHSWWLKDMGSWHAKLSIC